MDKEKEKTAKFKLSLKDKSGYTSKEEGMISDEQYGRICKILNEKDEPKEESKTVAHHPV